MVRMARVVVPDLPHHVTQRGNRRQQTFFCDDDYRVYRDLMSEWCAKCGVEIWCYCLMPNHVYVIAVPETADGLRTAIGEAHRRYTRRINVREGWRSYLWQGRFASFPMDEAYLLAAARYVEWNPVRAKMVACVEDYQWSSARAHVRGYDDALVKVSPLIAAAGIEMEGLLEGLWRGQGNGGLALGPPGQLGDGRDQETGVGPEGGESWWGNVYENFLRALAHWSQGRPEHAAGAKAPERPSTRHFFDFFRVRGVTKASLWTTALGS